VNERRTVRSGGLVDWPLCVPNRGERSTRMLVCDLGCFKIYGKFRFFVDK